MKDANRFSLKYMSRRMISCSPSLVYMLLCVLISSVHAPLLPPYDLGAIVRKRARSLQAWDGTAHQSQRVLRARRLRNRLRGVVQEREPPVPVAAGV